MDYSAHLSFYAFWCLCYNYRQLIATIQMPIFHQQGLIVSDWLQFFVYIDVVVCGSLCASWCKFNRQLQATNQMSSFINHEPLKQRLMISDWLQWVSAYSAQEYITVYNFLYAMHLFQYFLFICVSSCFYIFDVAAKICLALKNTSHVWFLWLIVCRTSRWVMKLCFSPHAIRNW